MPPLESVPNVSEGRDPERIAELARAFSGGARLLDVHTDPDHHRSVLTLVGDDEPLVDSLLAGIARAYELIDLRMHEGAHPRTGAVDVVPLVALAPEDRERAREVALVLARRAGDELGASVFLYGAVGEGRRPSFFRRGGLDGLRRRVDDGDLRPDFGTARLDPAVGAVLVGARPPLLAYNVDLLTDDIGVAKEVADAVRESGGGFPGVRALGLRLERAGRVQVSMNVEDWRASPPHEVTARIVELAAVRGVETGTAELVGLAPAGAVALAARDQLRLPHLGPEHVLEARALGG